MPVRAPRGQRRLLVPFERKHVWSLQGRTLLNTFGKRAFRQLSNRSHAGGRT